MNLDEMPYSTKLYFLKVSNKFSSDFHEHEVTFRMDEAFHIPWENGKSISHFCKRPQYAVIECTTKEPMKNWNLRTRMIFSDLGT